MIKMQKGVYYIACKGGDDIVLKEKQGYIIQYDGERYGAFWNRKEQKWELTDLATGLYISAKLCNRKSLLGFIPEVTPMLKKHHEKHPKEIELFNTLLSETL